MSNPNNSFFPAVRILWTGMVEDLLVDMPALDVEENFANYLKIKREKEKTVSFQKNKNDSFKNANLNVFVKDYYFSNVIARSSKTMLDCKNAKLNIKRTGTEG